MNMKFITSDYLLAWNILFTKSMTEKLKDTKKKLWNIYRDEYNNIYYEKDLILKDYKNFIPNNDNVYNAITSQEEFNTILKEADKTRIYIMGVWDKHSKLINNFFKNVIRINMPEYNAFILNKEFNYLDIVKLDKKESAVIIGKKYKSDNEFLMNFVKEIVYKEVEIKEKTSLEIKEAILELAVLNEFPTLLDKKSHYKDGNSKYQYLKIQIYPYWLMFLGIKKEDMVSYMQRDGIKFDENKIAYEKELINLNLEEFIDFIIRNKRYIIKINKLASDDIEEL